MMKAADDVDNVTDLTVSKKDETSEAAKSKTSKHSQKELLHIMVKNYMEAEQQVEKDTIQMKW